MPMKKGYETLSGTDSIDVGETSKISSNDVILVKKDSKTSNFIGILIIAIIFVLIIVIGVVIIFFIMKKKGDETFERNDDVSPDKNENSINENNSKSEESTEKNYYENPYRIPDAVYENGDYIRPKQ
jgi:flagellar basal body-associated protein FliL